MKTAGNRETKATSAPLTSLRPISRRRNLVLAIVTLCASLVVAGAATSVARSTTYDDIVFDSSGNEVAIAAERPWLRPYDVGAKCLVLNSQITLMVRPPTVWPLTGYSSESVAWRAFYVDLNTGQPVARNDWVGGTAYSSRPAAFGRQDPTDIFDNNYWLNSQLWQRPDGTYTTYPFGDIVPYIQVAWYTPNGWIYRSLRVDWAESGIDRSVGGAYC